MPESQYSCGSPGIARTNEGIAYQRRKIANNTLNTIEMIMLLVIGK